MLSRRWTPVDGIWSTDLRQVRGNAARRVPGVRVVGVCQPAPRGDAVGRGADCGRRSPGHHGHWRRPGPAPGRRRVRGHRSGPAPSGRGRRRGVPRFRPRDPRAALPRRRAGDGLARPRRSVDGAAGTRWTDRGADVPPGSPRDSRCTARRSRAARRTRSGRPPRASDCLRIERWRPCRARGATNTLPASMVRRWPGAMDVTSSAWTTGWSSDERCSTPHAPEVRVCESRLTRPMCDRAGQEPADEDRWGCGSAG